MSNLAIPSHLCTSAYQPPAIPSAFGDEGTQLQKTKPLESSSSSLVERVTASTSLLSEAQKSSGFITRLDVKSSAFAVLANIPVINVIVLYLKCQQLAKDMLQRIDMSQPDHDLSSDEFAFLKEKIDTIKEAHAIMAKRVFVQSVAMGALIWLIFILQLADCFKLSFKLLIVISVSAICLVGHLVILHNSPILRRLKKAIKKHQPYNLAV